MGLSAREWTARLSKEMPSQPWICILDGTSMKDCHESIRISTSLPLCPSQMTNYGMCVNEGPTDARTHTTKRIRSQAHMDACNSRQVNMSFRDKTQVCRCLQNWGFYGTACPESPWIPYPQIVWPPRSEKPHLPVQDWAGHILSDGKGSVLFYQTCQSTIAGKVKRGQFQGPQ